MNTASVVLYGSGDPGTAELRSLAFALGIPVDFRDIRTSDADGGRSFMVELSMVTGGTVPVLITPDGIVLSNYEGALDWLKAQPRTDLVKGMAS